MQFVATAKTMELKYDVCKVGKQKATGDEHVSVWVFRPGAAVVGAVVECRKSLHVDCDSEGFSGGWSYGRFCAR